MNKLNDYCDNENFETGIAIKIILQDMKLDNYSFDPGGFKDWIPMLVT
jgi:hypothetical protein